jgi:ectoine hydroxylase-related dioxygenase (phytanoyl-CoA dioxygenase family)
MKGEQYYSVFIDRESEILEQYPSHQPVPCMGDLLIMDYLTLHASGVNLTQRPRWSIQFRYFNYNHDRQITQGWHKSFAEGNSIRQAHPELIVSSLEKESV